MAGPMTHDIDQRNSNLMIQRWLKKYYPLEHTSISYIGMYGVWDVMGHHELDSQVYIHGRTEQLKELKKRICDAIDTELERRETTIKT